MTEEDKNTQENQQETAIFNKYDELDSVDKAIIKLRIEFPAISIVSIAEKLQVHRDTVSSKLKKEKVAKSISELEKSALQILLDGQVKAARKLIKHIDANEDADSIRACKIIVKGVLSDNVDINIKDLEKTKKELKDFFNKTDDKG